MSAPSEVTFYFEPSFVSTPADKKPGRVFLGGTLYDFHGHSYNNYHELAVCANCDKIRRSHTGEEMKCLFEPTQFKFVYEKEENNAEQVQSTVGSDAGEP